MIAPTAEEARSIATAVRKGTGKIPGRWEGLLTAEALASPLVVVRVIDPARAEHAWQPAAAPALEEKPKHRMVVVVPAADNVTMNVRVSTTNKDRARKMLDELLESHLTETQDGFESTLPQAGDREGPSGEGQFLRILCLYGLRIVI